MMYEQFRRYRHVFWDFDGVIKDSVAVKEQAFAALFETFGTVVTEKIRQHHRINGGMSRYEKIPLYFREFAGIEPTGRQLAQALADFEALAYRRVVESAWIPGARELIQGNPWNQAFYLVTATPKEEIDRIVHEIGLAACFAGTFGAPQAKSAAIKEVMDRANFVGSSCLMIGDSLSDLQAAMHNGIDFLLRETPGNAIIAGQVSMDFRVKDFAALTGPGRRHGNAPQ